MNAHVERVEKEAGDGWTGDAVCVSKEVALDIAKRCDTLEATLATINLVIQSNAKMAEQPKLVGTPKTNEELVANFIAYLGYQFPATIGHLPIKHFLDGMLIKIKAAQYQGHDLSTCPKGHNFRTVSSHPAKNEREWECPNCMAAEIRGKNLAISTLLKAIASHSCNYKIGHPLATEPCPLCVIEKQGQNFTTHAS